MFPYRTAARAIEGNLLKIVLGRHGKMFGHIYAVLSHCQPQLHLYRLDPNPTLLTTTRRAMDFLLAKDGMAITGGDGIAYDQADSAEARVSMADSSEQWLGDMPVRGRSRPELHCPPQRSVHHVPQRLAEEHPAAGVTPLHPHVEQPLLGIEGRVRVDDQPLEGRMAAVPPGDEQRVVGRRRLLREYVDGGSGQPSRGKRRRNRSGIDHAAPGGVHEIRPSW